MSRNNTVGGSYRTTPVNKMHAFDKLPPETRAAVANAVEDWVPQTLLTNYRRGCNDEVLAMMVRRYDAAELAEREKQRARGIGPYKAPDQKTLKPKRGRRP